MMYHSVARRSSISDEVMKDIDNMHSRHRKSRCNISDDGEDLFLSLVLERREVLNHEAEEVEGVLADTMC